MEDDVAMRDKLIHHFFQVNWKIVWNVLTTELPPLKVHIEWMLRDSQEILILRQPISMIARSGECCIGPDFDAFAGGISWTISHPSKMITNR